MSDNSSLGTTYLPSSRGDKKSLASRNGSGEGYSKQSCSVHGEADLRVLGDGADHCKSDVHYNFGPILLL